MKYRICYALSIICLCLFSINLYADEKNEISLENAIKIALNNNPSLKTKREIVNVKKTELVSIPLFSNPELETEIIGGEHDEQIVEISKSIELGGQRKHRKQAAKLNHKIVELELTEATLKLIKSVKLAFYQLLYVQEKLKITKEIINNNQRMFDIAQIRYETGDISFTQVGIANIQVQSSRRELAMMENELLLTQLALNGLMSTDLDTTHVAVGVFPEIISNNIEFDTLQQKALDNRIELKSLRLNVELTETSYKLAKAMNIPDLNIGGIAERNSGEMGFGIKFSLPLPIINSNRVDINAAKAQKLVDKAEITNAQHNIVREVKLAYLSWKAARKNLKFYEGNLLKLLDENLSHTRSAYELGEAKLLEVILLQNEFAKTQYAYLDAIIMYQKSTIELENVIGTSY